MDNAGNTGAPDSFTWTVDTTPPAISLTAPANGSATNNRTPTFSGIASTALGDSSFVAIRVFSGTDVTGTLVRSRSAIRNSTTGAHSTTLPSTAPLSEDTYTVQVRQSDQAGNTGVSATNTFVVDTTPPTISAAVAAGTLGSNGWYTSNVTVRFTCTDGGSGIPTGACPVDQVLSAEGAAVSPTAQTVADVAGNVSAQSNVVPVQIDKTAPAIAVSHTANGANGWNISSPVAVTMTASDATSGLNGAPICTDGTTSLTLTAGAAGTWTASVSGDGTHPLSCSVSDNAGNSKTATDAVSIDTVAPSGTITINSGAAYTTSPSVTLNLSATDATSKIVTYRIATGSDCSGATFIPAFTPISPYSANVAFALPSGDGAKTVCVQYQDAAGNSSATATHSITLDTTPPDTSISAAVDGTGKAVGSGGVTTSPQITFTFAGTDNLTLAAALTFQCQRDGGSFGPCPGTTASTPTTAIYNNLAVGPTLLSSTVRRRVLLGPGAGRVRLGSRAAGS